MPQNTIAREKLREAIAEELTAQRRAQETYELLTAKMLAYQMGHGPAPTNEDFQQWSNAVEQRVKLRQLGIAGEPGLNQA